MIDLDAIHSRMVARVNVWDQREEDLCSLLAECRALRAEVESLREAADGAMRQDRDQLLAENTQLKALLGQVEKLIERNMDGDIVVAGELIEEALK